MIAVHYNDITRINIICTISNICDKMYSQSKFVRYYAYEKNGDWWNIHL